jgi:predicted glycosyltransferase
MSIHEEHALLTERGTDLEATWRGAKARVALYSPGIAGLGHMRRNLLIGQAIASSQLGVVTLMVAEARQACAFALPPGMDCVTLPALQKQPDGKCQPRYLDTSLQDLIRLRARVIRAALDAFEPDVLIVDFLPRGRHGELADTLDHLRAAGGTRCVLGLREVLENPASWLCGANEAEIRSYYDAVWVYGDPVVYDLVREQRFPPDLAAKTHYTGYLDQRTRLRFMDGAENYLLERLGLAEGRLALCLVGGGADGVPLAEAFALAELPPQTNAVILTGPYMPEESRQCLRQQVARNPRLRVLEFIPEPAPLLRQADRIVAMGGYNTVSEILSYEKPALIVPRTNPREQLVRAERLRDLGLVEVLDPEQLSPRALAEWLARDLQTPRVHERLDMNGLARLPRLLEQVLGGADRHYAGGLCHAGT